MKKKNKLSYCVYSSILLVAMLVCNQDVIAQDNMQSEQINQRVEKIKDFKEDKESAKKWAEKEFEKWNKEIKPEEKKAFDEMKERNVNLFLKMFGSHLSGFSIESQDVKDSTNEAIKKMDKALSSKNAKINESLKVYQNIKTAELVRTLIDEDIFEANGQVNQEKYGELKDSLTGMRYESYGIADIAYTPDKDARFKVEIIIPKGERVGYAFENQLVLEKDKALEVTKVNRIIEKGKEKIKIETKLVDKEKIDKKINAANIQDNKELNERMGYESGAKLLEYRFTGALADSLSKETKEAFKELENRVETEIFGAILDFMEEGKGKFYFVDRQISTYPEAFFPHEITEELQGALWDAEGLTVYEKRDIWIDMLENRNDHSDTIVHEFGHLADQLIGDISWGSSEINLISESKDFKAIFGKEGKNLTEYGSKSREEFFAEAFRMYYSSNPEEKEELKDNAPQTYDFMEEVIEIIRGSLTQ